MNDWAGLFLAVIALTAVVQCVFIIVAARSLQSTGQRVSELCSRFDRELKPTLEDLRQGAANLRAITEAGHAQTRRIEALLSSAIASVELTVENARSIVMGPIKSFAELSAFWGGLKRGVDAFRGSDERNRSAPSTSRRAEDSDEHMFIG